MPSIGAQAACKTARRQTSAATERAREMRKNTRPEAQQQKKRLKNIKIFASCSKGKCELKIK